MDQNRPQLLGANTAQAKACENHIAFLPAISKYF